MGSGKRPVSCGDFQNCLEKKVFPPQPLPSSPHLAFSLWEERGGNLLAAPSAPSSFTRARFSRPLEEGCTQGSKATPHLPGVPAHFQEPRQPAGRAQVGGLVAAVFTSLLAALARLVARTGAALVGISHLLWVPLWPAGWSREKMRTQPHRRLRWPFPVGSWPDPSQNFPPASGHSSVGVVSKHLGVASFRMGWESPQQPPPSHFSRTALYLGWHPERPHSQASAPAVPAGSGHMETPSPCPPPSFDSAP